MVRQSIVACAAFLAATSMAMPMAHAQQWQVCNKTPYTVSVAVGYAVPNGHLMSEGWFTLGPCTGCQVVALPEETVDRSAGWIWAKAQKGPMLVEGSETLCVNMKKSFKIRGGQNCEGRNFVSKGFARQNIDMTKDFTSNIRGDKQCNL